MNIILQGDVDAVNGTKIVCTTFQLSISSIVINNLGSNYMFTLNRVNSEPGSVAVPVYQFDLQTGDSIRDNEGYILSTGDYLELTSDVTGTTFYISAIQI